MDFIEIDGSYLEGGGQILRSSVGLSALTGKACRVYNIRACRKMPGLREQHTQAINAVASLCNAKTRNVTVGSSEIEFIPGKIEKHRVEVDISTAGSVSLVMQALMLPCINLNHALEIDIKGGATYGKWAPPVDYTSSVLKPILEKSGFSFEIDVIRHGFYPKGMANVRVKIPGNQKLKKLELLERGNVEKIRGFSIATANLEKAGVAGRQAESAKKELRNQGMNIEIQEKYVESPSTGTGIVLCAECENSVIGASALGEIRKTAEFVGKEAATELKNELKTNAGVDKHMADQILPYLAFLGGNVRVPEFTGHVKTNIWVIEQFLGKKFETDKEKKTVSVNV